MGWIIAWKPWSRMGWHVAGGKFKDEKFDATEHILSLGGDGNVKYRLS